MARRLRPEANSLYGTPSPITSLDLIPVTYNRAPTVLDLGFTNGQLWYDQVGGVEYVLSSVAGGVATWTAITAAAGVLVSLTDQTAAVRVPLAGTITINGANNITTTGAANTVTVTGSLTPTYTTVKSGKYQTVAGAGASSGIATLAAGTKVVATTAIAAGSVVLVSVNTLGTVATPQALRVPSASIIAGTSFAIFSADGTDTSTVNWFIVTPV